MKKTKAIAILILLCGSAQACVATDPKHSQPRTDAEVRMAKIYIEDEESRFTLLDLHRLALARLESKYPVFKDSQAIKREPDPTVSINLASRERFVTLFYLGKLGEEFWHVTFSNKGKVTGHFSGVLVEGVKMPPGFNP